MKNILLKRASFFILTFLTTVFGFIWGAPFLNIFYHLISPYLFWFLLSSLSALLWFFEYPFLSGIFMSLSFLVVFQFELQKKSSLWISCFLSLIFSFTIAVLFFWLWTLKLGPSWYEQLLNTFQQFTSHSLLENLSSKVEPKTLLFQIPSIGICALCVALFLSLILEKKLLTWIQYKPVPPLRNQKHKLLEFRNPNFIIWIFIFSTAGSFLKTKIEWFQIISINVLNVTLMFYFFQGLCIVKKCFIVYKIKPLYRFILYILIALQLFLSVSFLGILDFWFDFRKKTRRS